MHRRGGGEDERWDGFCGPLEPLVLSALVLCLLLGVVTSKSREASGASLGERSV